MLDSNMTVGQDVKVYISVTDNTKNQRNYCETTRADLTSENTVSTVIIAT